MVAFHKRLQRQSAGLGEELDMLTASPQPEGFEPDRAKDSRPEVALLLGVRC